MNGKLNSSLALGTQTHHWRGGGRPPGRTASSAWRTVSRSGRRRPGSVVEMDTHSVAKTKGSSSFPVSNEILGQYTVVGLQKTFLVLQLTRTKSASSIGLGNVHLTDRLSSGVAHNEIEMWELCPSVCLRLSVHLKGGSLFDTDWEKTQFNCHVI